MASWRVGVGLKGRPKVVSDSLENVWRVALRHQTRLKMGACAKRFLLRAEDVVNELVARESAKQLG